MLVERRSFFKEWQKQQSGEQLTQLLRLVSAFLGTYLLAELVFSGAHLEAKMKVKERANSHCEGCGKKTTKKPAGKNGRSRGNLGPVIAHLNHTRNDEYDNLANLRSHCLYCETIYHASHVGRADRIGMKEESNKAAAMTWLTTIAKKVSQKEFLAFYAENQSVIDKLFVSMNRELSDFIHTNTGWKKLPN
ncbi:MAG TPA: hypothetical protein VGA89_00580 [Patescibacteria group bacterium]